MKNLLLSILFLIYIPELSYAQKFHFSDTSNIWKVEYYKLHDGRYPYQSTWSCRYLDTTIMENGITYLVFKSEEDFRSALIREDTLAQKVYAKFKPDIYNRSVGLGQSVNDTNEFVLYDYSLNIGDTLKMPLSIHPNFDTTYHYLIGLDSILIDGLWYKVQEFLYSAGPFGIYDSYKVIEGIGSLTGPISLQPLVNFEAKHQLFCFENRGTGPLLDEPVYTGIMPFTNKCIPFHSNIDEGVIDPDIWRIYPNPSRDQITIASDKEKIRVNIYDVFGSTVYKSGQYQMKTVIDVTHWSTGLYIIEIEDTKGKRGRRKLEIAD